VYALLAEIWHYRELLWTLIVRELRVRYKNSVLGFFWSLVNPLVTVLVMTVVFKYVMGMRIANYSAYVLTAYYRGPFSSSRCSIPARRFWFICR
jgi:ABC-type polysaccharide/polyol phosphate export permease